MLEEVEESDKGIFDPNFMKVRTHMESQAIEIIEDASAQQIHGQYHIDESDKDKAEDNEEPNKEAEEAKESGISQRRIRLEVGKVTPMRRYTILLVNLIEGASSKDCQTEICCFVPIGQGQDYSDQWCLRLGEG